jgi:hypothetical protein
VTDPSEYFKAKIAEAIKRGDSKSVAVITQDWNNAMKTLGYDPTQSTAAGAAWKFGNIASKINPMQIATMFGNSYRAPANATELKGVVANKIFGL